MAVLIDDRPLLDVLARAAPPSVAAQLGRGEVLTTSSWCYRLRRAAFSGSDRGALSAPLSHWTPTFADTSRPALQDLPEDVGLLHPRVVAPVMFALRLRRLLNVLSAEALAVAALVEGGLLVTTDAPMLRAGALELGVPYAVVT